VSGRRPPVVPVKPVGRFPSFIISTKRSGRRGGLYARPGGDKPRPYIFFISTPPVCHFDRRLVRRSLDEGGREKSYSYMKIKRKDFSLCSK